MSDTLKKTNSETTTDSKSLGTESKAKDNKSKKKFKIKKGPVVLIIIILAVILFFLLKSCGVVDKWFPQNNADGQNQLSVYSVSRRTITKTLTSTGTIIPNDEFSINALVSGEIVADHFEEGDDVEEDELLYEVETDNLDSSVERARNALKRAETSLEEARENLEKLNVNSDYSGTVEELFFEVGEDVAAGQVVASVVDKSVMCIDIPFMSSDAQNIKIGDVATLTFEPSQEVLTGRVTEISPTTRVNALNVVTRDITISVNNIGSITPSSVAYAKIGDAVCTENGKFYYNDEGQIIAKMSGKVSEINFKEGQYISKNQVILHLSSTTLENQIQNLELSIEDAKSQLDDSLDAYDNYNITSPISGKVIKKEYKQGDTLGGGSYSTGASAMAIIYDMSALKFEMSIDELDIDSLNVGQEVVITADAREGETYYGKVTNISIQGTTTNGTTVYPVVVTIDNVEDETKRVTDEDGTIHKTYKTGKTSVIKNHKLVSLENNDGVAVYTYDNDVVVLGTANDDGTVTFKDDLGNVLKKKSDGRYSYNGSFYSFSDDFSNLVLEVEDNSRMLRPGMNVDADIVVQKVENVIAVPSSAVLRGYVVKVIKTDKSNSEQANKNDSENEKPMSKDYTKLVPGEYGTAPNSVTFEEVKVETGINDEEFIEIISGLEVGDVVILEEINNYANEQSPMMQMGGGMPMGDGDVIVMGGGGMNGGGMGGPSSGMGGIRHPF